MELSFEVFGKRNKASDWWTAYCRVKEEAEKHTLELVRTLLEEVGSVEFDECHRCLERPYYDGGDHWKIGCIKGLYINENDAVVAALVDGTETLLADFDCLGDAQIWNAITDSLGLSED